jgi:hypothetical protein
MRMLLLQSFLVWLMLRLDKLHLSTPIDLAIGSAIGSVVYSLKHTLDDRLGFILPLDTPRLLPILLDKYIIKTMPDLAVLLGESPCSTRIASIHPETGICEPELGYDDYGVPAAKARKHHDRCHVRRDTPSWRSIRVCIRAKEQIEKKKQVCFYIPPLIDCTIQYSKWEDLGVLLNAWGYSGDEHLAQGVCDKRVIGDMYIDGRFRGFRPGLKVTG